MVLIVEVNKGLSAKKKMNIENVEIEYMTFKGVFSLLGVLYDYHDNCFVFDN